MASGAESTIESIIPDAMLDKIAELIVLEQADLSAAWMQEASVFNKEDWQ